MDQLRHALAYSFLDVSLYHYLLALSCLAGGWVLRQILMGALRHVMHLSAKTETAIDDILIDAISKPLSLMCFVLGVWAAIEVLPLSPELINFARFVRGGVKAVTVLVVVWFALRLIDRSTRHMQERAVETKSPILDFVPLFRKTAKIFLVLIGILIIIQDLGYSVASLIAGLGLGGLALGLAAKDTLANFFGSVVIFVDRPFTRGDWIKIGEHDGVVEEISIRVTRIRTFQDSLITIPNAQLTTTPIINWTAMRKRRVRFSIDVAPDTPPRLVEQVVAAIRDWILSDARFLADGLTVAVTALNNYSLNVLVNAYTATAEYPPFVAAQQDLLLNALRILREHEIALAFPTQTLNVSHESALVSRSSSAES
ncbi:mechanosensitive ion channel family protein [candidate division KSB1 bacterium]|nr:mechanosensitive ion channel family protein [candidate division KSB1 bacterium]